MNARTPTPNDPAPSLWGDLQTEHDRLQRLFDEYRQLAREQTPCSDLAARALRIGGRLRGLLAFEREHLLAGLPDRALLWQCGTQIDALLGQIEGLAERTADQAATERSMAALARAFQAHAVWQSIWLWPALPGDAPLEPLREALAEARAAWLQDEAAD